MPNIRRIAVLAVLAALLLAGPGFAQSVIGGATPGGAFYTLAVPPLWNGQLVIYNHGFSLDPIGPVSDLGPLADLQLAEGYAIAASSYRDRGWALFGIVEDLEGMYQAFVDNFGPPTQVLVYGPSLGGLVTARAIEQAELGNVVGALPFCGAMAGSRNWDGGLDFRLIYDFLCQNVPGANIPGGAKGLPVGSTLGQVDVVTAANVCFGHDFPPAARSPQQQARLNRFLALTKLPQEFINADIVYTTFAMGDLVNHPGKLGGQIGTGNRNVNYGAADVNAGIQRVGAGKAQRKLLRDNYTPTGNVGGVKIVSIHTDQDGLVIVENQNEYASKVPRGNLTVGIVQEAVPTHCGFSTTELIAAWETLRGWVAGDPQPSPFALAAMCAALQPTFGGSCRYNPFYQVPDMNGRIRRRNPANALRAESNKGAAPAVPAAAAPSSPPPVAASAPAAPAADVPAAADPTEPASPAQQAAPLSAFDDADIDATRLYKLERLEK